MKLREIERLRAIAALMVVFTHTGPQLPQLQEIFGHPRTGVDLFFVISGFVVTRSLVRLLPELSAATGLGGAFDQARTGLRLFYTRRFFRIVPLAVVAIIAQRLLFALALPPSALGGDRDGFWREVFAIFAGVYNYAMPNEGYNQFGVFWSLSVEEHFYLLLPLAFLLVRTRSRRIVLSLAGIAFVAFVCRDFFDTPPPGTVSPDYYRIFTSHLRFDALLAGVAMALLFEAAPDRPFLPPRFMKWVVLPGCLAIVWAIPKVLPGNTYFHQGFLAAWFFSSILVAYASFDKGYVFEIPVVGRVLEYLGGRSYALYLLHIPLMRLAVALGEYHPAVASFKTEHPWAHWSLFLVALMAASEASWRLLEWPMQKLGRRLSDTSLPPWKPGVAGRAVLGGLVVGVAMLVWHHEIHRLFSSRNLALDRPVTASPVDPSQPDPQQLTNGKLESKRGLHTKKEKEPWAMIDLGAETPIGSILTYNRADGWENEVLPLKIEVSSDGTTFTPVATRTTIFSQWIPWRVNLHGMAARYVRYSGGDDAYLCLAEAEVFAP